MKQKEVKEIEEKLRKGKEQERNGKEAEKKKKKKKKWKWPDACIRRPVCMRPLSNVRKDPSDDFDLLSDDGMMDYVPGVDDVDHFDFDEEGYRTLPQESMNRKRLSETDAGSSVRWRNSVYCSAAV